MKIESPVCDVHPDSPLEAAEIRILTGSEVSCLLTFRCMNPTCNRHYHSEHGYFTNIVGQHFDFGDLSTKRKCGNNHHVLYLIVAKVNGRIVWACPEDDCDTTEQFQEGA